MEKNSQAQPESSMPEVLHILQIAGGTFPIGGFSQSYGLETYVSDGRVNDADTLVEFMKTYLETTIANQDGVVVAETHRLVEKRAWEELAALNELAVAAKMTAESRGAALKTGRAIMRIGRTIFSGEEKSVWNLDALRNAHGAVAFGALSQSMGIALKPAVTAYAYASLNTLLQSGIKLIPLGNIEAQQLLYKVLLLIEPAAQHALSVAPDEINNFSPCLELACIQHEQLPTRLYMS